jgi:gamma-glutamylaminecyclotransferase
MEPILLFVYGTLRRGGKNHFYLAKTSFQGNAETYPEYTLGMTDEYLILQEGGRCCVSGEVYSVPPHVLSQLDNLESTSTGLFTRRRVALKEPFIDQVVYTYIYTHSPV